MAPASTLLAHLAAPVDGASTRAFRLGFGLLLAAALARLHLTGWTGPLFLEPTFRFRYSEFAFLPTLPGPLVVPVLALGAVAALGLGLGQGLLRRGSGLVFVACFGWLKLSDVTNYLNHDYLALLLAALLTALPLDGAAVPRWAMWLLRLQVGLVYVFAGLAKVQSDWLWLGEPLRTWFDANRGLPLLGPVLGWPGVALAASWAACLYDLTIPFWLSWRRSRPLAFVVLLAFHGGTHLLFDIGIFPFLMTLSATLFFEPGWPRRWWAFPTSWPVPAAPLPVPLALGLALYVGWQVVFPLRFLALSRDVLWDELGMRWSWRVMVREKNGAVSFRVRPRGEEREWEVPVGAYLTPRQANEMSGQPDLILQLARHVAQDVEARLGRPVELRVDALVSLNGRPPRPLFRPEVDVSRLPEGALSLALAPSPRLSP